MEGTKPIEESGLYLVVDACCGSSTQSQKDACSLNTKRVTWNIFADGPSRINHDMSIIRL